MRVYERVGECAFVWLSVSVGESECVGECVCVGECA